MLKLTKKTIYHPQVPEADSYQNFYRSFLYKPKVKSIEIYIFLAHINEQFMSKIRIPIRR